MGGAFKKQLIKAAGKQGFVHWARSACFSGCAPVRTSSGAPPGRNSTAKSDAGLEEKWVRECERPFFRYWKSVWTFAMKSTFRTAGF